MLIWLQLWLHSIWDWPGLIGSLVYDPGGGPGTDFEGRPRFPGQILLLGLWIVFRGTYGQLIMLDPLPQTLSPVSHPCPCNFVVQVQGGQVQGADPAPLDGLIQLCSCLRLLCVYCSTARSTFQSELQVLSTLASSWTWKSTLFMSWY